MKKTFVWMALVLLLGLSACQGERKTTPLTLKIGAMSSMDYLPFVVAEKMGMYDSLGLELDIVKFFSANERDAAFQAGSIDGTVIDYTGAALQHAKGIPLGVVMKLDGYFTLVGQPKQEAASLKGMNIGIARHTVIEYSTDYILQKAGLTEADVTKTEINKIPLRTEMLLRGELDATVLPDPFMTKCLSQGFSSIANTKDLGISVTGLMLSKKALEEKGGALALLIEGYNLAVDYILSHPVEDLTAILVEDAGMEPSLVGFMPLPAFTHAEMPREQDLQAVFDWLKKKELVPQDYTGADLLAGPLAGN